MLSGGQDSNNTQLMLRLEHLEKEKKQRDHQISALEQSLLKQKQEYQIAVKHSDDLQRKANELLESNSKLETCSKKLRDELKQNEFKMQNLVQQLSQKDQKLRVEQQETRRLQTGSHQAMMNDPSHFMKELDKQQQEMDRLEREHSRFEQEKFRMDNRLKLLEGLQQNSSSNVNESISDFEQQIRALREENEKLKSAHSLNNPIKLETVSASTTIPVTASAQPTQTTGKRSRSPQDSINNDRELSDLRSDMIHLSNENTKLTHDISRLKQDAIKAENEKIAALKQKDRLFSEQAASFEQDRERLEEKYSMIQNELDEMSKKRANLLLEHQTEKESLKRQVDQYQTEVHSLKENVLRISKELDEKQVSFTKLEQQFNERQHVINLLEQRLVDTIQEKEMTIINLQYELKQTQQDLVDRDQKSGLQDENHVAKTHEVSQLQQIVEHLNVKLQNVEQEVNTKTIELQSSNENQAKLSDEVTGLKADLDRNLQKLADAEAQLKVAIVKLSQTQFENENLQDTISDLQSSMDTLEKSKVALVEENKSLVNKLSFAHASDCQINESVHAVLEDSKGMKQKLDALITEKEGLLSKCSEAQALTSALQEKLTQMAMIKQNEVAKVESELQDALTRIDVFKSTIDDMNFKQQNLENQLAQGSQEFKDLKNHCEKLMADLENKQMESGAAHEQTRKVMDEVNQLRHEIDVLQNQKQEITKKLEFSDQTLNQFQTANAAKDTEIRSLEKLLKQTSEQLENVQEKLNEAQASVVEFGLKEENHERRIRQLQTTINTLTRDLSDRTATLAQVQASLQEASSLGEFSKVEHQALQDYSESLVQEVSRLKEQIEMEQTLKMTELSNMGANFEKCSEKLELLQVEHESLFRKYELANQELECVKRQYNEELSLKECGVESMKIDLEKIKLEVHRLTSERESLLQQYEQVQHEVERQRLVNNEQESRIQKISLEQEQSLFELTDKRQELETKEDALAKVNEAHELLKQNLNFVEARHSAEKELLIETHKHEIDSALQDFEVKCRNLKNTLETLSNEKEYINQKLLNSVNDLNLKNNEIDVLIQEKANLTKELEQKQDDIDSMIRKTEDYKTNLANAQATIETYKTQLNQERASKRCIDEDKESLIVRLEELQLKSEQYNKEHMHLEDRITVLTSQVEVLEKKNNDIVVEMKETQSKFELNVKELESLQAELRDCKGEISKLNITLCQKQAQIDIDIDLIDELNLSVERLKNELIQKQDVFDERTKHVREQYDQQIKLNTDCFNERIAEHQRQVKEYEEKYESMLLNTHELMESLEETKLSEKKLLAENNELAVSSVVNCKRLEERLSIEANEMKVQIETLIQETSDKNQELQKINDILSDKNVLLQEKDSILSHTKAELSDTQRLCDTLQKEVCNLQNELAVSRELVDARLSDISLLETKLEQAEQALLNKQSQVYNLQNDLILMEDRIKESNYVIDKMGEKLNETQQLLESLKIRNTSLEQENANLLNNDGLEAAKGELASAIAEKQDVEHSLNHIINGLKYELTTVESNMSELRSTYEFNLSSLNAQKEELAISFQDAQDRFRVTETELTISIEELKDVVEKQAKDVTDLASMAEYGKNIRIQVQTLEAIINDLETTLMECQESKDANDALIEQYHQRTEDLESKLANMEEAKSLLEEELGAANQKVLEIEHRLVTAAQDKENVAIELKTEKELAYCREKDLIYQVELLTSTEIKMKSELSVLNADLQKNGLELEQISRQLSELQQMHKVENEQFEKEIHAMTDELQTVTKNLQESETLSSDLKLKLIDLENQLKTANIQIEESQKDNMAKIAELNTMYECMMVDLDEKAKYVVELEERLSQSTRSLSRLEELNTRLQQDNEDIPREMMKDHQSVVQGLQSSLTEASSANHKLEQELSMLENKLETSEKELNKLKMDMLNLKSEHYTNLETLKGQLKFQEEKAKVKSEQDFETQLHSVRAELETKEEIITNLESRLKSAEKIQDQYLQVRQDRDLYQRRYEKLKSKLEVQASSDNTKLTAKIHTELATGSKRSVPVSPGRINADPKKFCVAENEPELKSVSTAELRNRPPLQPRSTKQPIQNSRTVPDSTRTEPAEVKKKALGLYLSSDEFQRENSRPPNDEKPQTSPRSNFRKSLSRLSAVGGRAQRVRHETTSPTENEQDENKCKQQ